MLNILEKAKLRPEQGLLDFIDLLKNEPELINLIKKIAPVLPCWSISELSQDTWFISRKQNNNNNFKKVTMVGLHTSDMVYFILTHGFVLDLKSYIQEVNRKIPHIGISLSLELF